ncbi:MAG: CRISPR-associated endonuclease Cas1 [Acidimicrobiales bacterium]
MSAAPVVVAGSRPLSDEDVADRLHAIGETFHRQDSAGVAVVDGFGVRVRLERGHLEVSDGIGQDRRTRTYDRATHGLRRIVVTNAAGVVSLDALRWCRSLGIGVLVLGPDGGVDLVSTPRATDDARLRRAQAIAAFEPYGLEIAQWLIARKLVGQARNLVRHFDDEETASDILGLVDTVEHVSAPDLADSAEQARSVIDAVRQLEASAAALYFGAWQGRPETSPSFAAKDRRRIPPHWSLYEGRRSVLASGNGNRKAERPVNALLNYCFALLEAEATFACQVVGLDPGLGIVHNDARGRASMALDVMEPVRPEVETFVLDMLARRTFRKADFVETPDGHVRLMAPVSHELAEMMPRWAQSLAPVAEKVAHMLGAAMEGKYSPATPLTRRRTRDAQAAVKARREVMASIAASKAPRRQRPSSEPVALPLWSCPDCAGPVTNPRHVRCETCIEADPTQSPEVRGRRGAAIAARKQALREWSDAHPGVAYDPEMFRLDIWPRLAGVKLSEIVEAIGCSKASASDIRRGKRTPHVSTWATLGEIARAEVPSASQSADRRQHERLV